MHPCAPINAALITRPSILQDSLDCLAHPARRYRPSGSQGPNLAISCNRTLPFVLSKRCRNETRRALPNECLANLQKRLPPMERSPATPVAPTHLWLKNFLASPRSHQSRLSQMVSLLDRPKACLPEQSYSCRSWLAHPTRGRSLPATTRDACAAFPPALGGLTCTGIVCMSTCCTV